MSMEFEINLDFEAIRARMEAAEPAALKAAGEHIGEVSAQEVPILEGTLLRSQRVEVDAANHQVSISYHTPYAHKQHEDTRLKHAHGNAKYLERPVMAERGKANEILAAGYRGAL